MRCGQPRPPSRISIPFWSDFNYTIDDKEYSTLQRFQSHFGLILTVFFSPAHSASVLISIPFWSDFNHEGRKYLTVILKTNEFQSHFGLILTHIWPYDKRIRLLKFQSHFGLILTGSLYPPFQRRKPISIPFWSDFNKKRRNMTMSFHLISIPFWSDFNKDVPGQTGEVSFDFNPILVWF